MDHFIILISHLFVILTAYNTLFSLIRTSFESDSICLYKRPGHMVDFSLFDVNVFTESKGGEYGVSLRSVMADNLNSCGAEGLLYESSSIVETKTKNKRKKKIYSTLKCKSSFYRNLGGNSLIKQFYDLNINLENRSLQFNEIKMTIDVNKTICFPKCSEEINTINCTVTGKFCTYAMAFAIIIILSYTILFILTRVKFKYYKTRKFIYKILFKFKVSPLCSEYVCCNERTKTGNLFKKGGFHYEISNQSSNRCHYNPDTSGLPLLKDDIFILGDKVVKVNYGEVTVMYLGSDKLYKKFKLEKRRLDSFIRYMRDFNSSNISSVVEKRGEFWHSLSVEEILEKLDITNNGNKIIQVENDCDFETYNPLDNLDYVYLSKKFSNFLKKDDLKSFYIHNLNFFKETNGNFSCLILLLNDKTKWYNKPVCVGYRKWSRYISEGKELSNKLCVGLNTDKDFKESEGRVVKIRGYVDNFIKNKDDIVKNTDLREKSGKDCKQICGYGVTLIEDEAPTDDLKKEALQLEQNEIEPISVDFVENIEKIYVKDIEERFIKSIKEGCDFFQSRTDQLNKRSYDMLRINLSKFLEMRENLNRDFNNLVNYFKRLDFNYKEDIKIFNVNDSEDKLIKKLILAKLEKLIITKNCESETKRLHNLTKDDPYLINYKISKSKKIEEVENKINKEDVLKLIESKGEEIVRKLIGFKLPASKSKNIKKKKKRGGKNKDRSNNFDKLTRFFYNNNISVTGLLNLSFKKVLMGNKRISANRLLEKGCCKSAVKKITTNYFVKTINNFVNKELNSKPKPAKEYEEIMLDLEVKNVSDLLQINFCEDTVEMTRSILSILGIKVSDERGFSMMLRNHLRKGTMIRDIEI